MADEGTNQEAGGGEEFVGIPLADVQAVLGKDVTDIDSAKKRIAHLNSMAGRMPDLEESHKIVQSLNAKLGNPDTFEEGVKEIYKMFDREYEPTSGNYSSGRQNRRDDVDDDDDIPLTAKEVKAMLKQAREEERGLTKKEIMSLVSPLLQENQLKKLSEKNPVFGDKAVREQAKEISNLLNSGKLTADEADMLAAVGKLVMSGEIPEALASSSHESFEKILKQLQQQASARGSRGSGGGEKVEPQMSAQEEFDRLYDNAIPKHALPTKKKPKK